MRKKEIFSTREQKAKANIVIAFFCQIITMVCGFIVPNLLIHNYGSEAYGATASIAQFLAYITLLEGGIGSVARAALYKPLAESNKEEISLVVAEIKHFFKIVAYIFAVYVLILAACFKDISDIQCFDWISTAVLVVVISISTFAQYFIGISNAVLLQAAQKTYITNIIATSTRVINTVMVVVLVMSGANLIIVKFFSSVVFVLKPIILWLYVTKNFGLIKIKKKNKNVLKQKWTGLGQHIAYFLHSNTDVAILTVLADLKFVSIYSVYSMITVNVQNLTVSFSTGMEALFGDMIAKKEIKRLNDSFDYYETLLSIIATVVFSCTIVLIVPFVQLYTKGITDADYYAPLFAILLTLSEYMFILRIPYHNVTIAAGVFKETRFAAYGEAIINIVITVLLVRKFNLVGVALGTLSAVVFRFLFYVIYLSKSVIHRKIHLFVKRMMTNLVNFILICFIGKILISKVSIDNYYVWCFLGCVMAVIATVVTLGFNYLLYKDNLKAISGRILRRKDR